MCWAGINASCRCGSLRRLSNRSSLRGHFGS